MVQNVCCPSVFYNFTRNSNIPGGKIFTGDWTYDLYLGPIPDLYDKPLLNDVWKILTKSGKENAGDIFLQENIAVYWKLLKYIPSYAERTDSMIISYYWGYPHHKIV